MYTMKKLLIVAGLFVAVSAQAADNTQAQSVFGKVTDAASKTAGSIKDNGTKAFSFVAQKATAATSTFKNSAAVAKAQEQASKLATKAITFGINDNDGQAKVVFVQGAKVVAVLVTSYALYYAYKKLFARPTKAVAIEEQEEPVYFYITTSQEEAKALAQAAQEYAEVAPVEVITNEIATECPEEAVCVVAVTPDEIGIERVICQEEVTEVASEDAILG
ncbi:MAG: hypothetical protein IT346_02145 [Epsilonproteobacteria bacterium]|nr:hypothetical protein [Campylobacterota bacterium]